MAAAVEPRAPEAAAGGVPAAAAAAVPLPARPPPRIRSAAVAEAAAAAPSPRAGGLSRFLSGGEVGECVTASAELALTVQSEGKVDVGSNQVVPRHVYDWNGE